MSSPPPPLSLPLVELAVGHDGRIEYHPIRRAVLEGLDLDETSAWRVDSSSSSSSTREERRSDKRTPLFQIKLCTYLVLTISRKDRLLPTK